MVRTRQKYDQLIHHSKYLYIFVSYQHNLRTQAEIDNTLWWFMRFSQQIE